MRLLFAEDDRDIAKAVQTLLQRSGYSVDTVFNGQDAVEYIEAGEYDGVILDWMMPKLSGIEVLSKMRSEGFSTPVLILTARDAVEDRVEGLDTGADDYLPKPFNPLELVARVKSQLRRYTKLGNIPQDSMEVYQVGGLVIHDDTKEVFVDDEPVKLTPIEYNILLLLVKNQGRVFSIDQIYEKIWNEQAIGADNTVAVHIRHIREKIEINPREPRYLKVVWGVGYKVDKI